MGFPSLQVSVLTSHGLPTTSNSYSITIMYKAISCSSRSAKRGYRQSTLLTRRPGNEADTGYTDGDLFRSVPVSTSSDNMCAPSNSLSCTAPSSCVTDNPPIVTPIFKSMFSADLYILDSVSKCTWTQQSLGGLQSVLPVRIRSSIKRNWGVSATRSPERGTDGTQWAGEASTLLTIQTRHDLGQGVSACPFVFTVVRQS